MVIWTFWLSLLWVVSFVSSSRIYTVSISVNDGNGWTTTNNASVYFILTTNDNGNTRNSPAYIIPNGLPNTKIYTYSLLLDDIGDVESLRLMHTDSKNALCIDYITVDNKTVSTENDQDYDCSVQYDCQQVTAYFETGIIAHSPTTAGCDWSDISAFAQMREYNIAITFSSTYNITVYSKIGLSIQGFVFKDYYSPYYDVSYDMHNTVHDYVDGTSKILLTLLTYDVTPIKSLLIANGNEEEICIAAVQITVNGYSEFDVEKADVATCIPYTGSNTNGCNVMNINLRDNEVTTEIQDICEIRYTSWKDEEDHRASRSQYTMTLDVTDDTKDYVFYMMIGHS